MNPYYYGLVKQVGPWKTTREDILRGQKPYQYTPNESTELPYDVKAGNGQLYEQYSSQGLIYDSASSPVVTIVPGKPKRGRIVRAKKKLRWVDSNGNPITPSENYFLGKYMGEMRGEVQNAIIESDLGAGQQDLAGMRSAAGSSASMGPATTSAMSTGGVSAMPEDGPAFEDLALEENVDRGAQTNDVVVNDQINYTQSLEKDRILNATNRRDSFRDTFLGGRLRNNLRKAKYDPLDEIEEDFRVFDPKNDYSDLYNQSSFAKNELRL